MSLKYAILGFISYAPLSGYDLKKAFDGSVRHFWPADQSQIYRTLSQLTAEKLITKEVIPREERLDRKVYHITAAGEKELHDWLTTPLSQQDTREPFLIQVYFSGKLSDEEALAILEHEREAVEQQLAEYEAIYEFYRNRQDAPFNPRVIFFSLLTLEYAITLGRPYLLWLSGVTERVRQGNYQSADLSTLL